MQDPLSKQANISNPFQFSNTNRQESPSKQPVNSAQEFKIPQLMSLATVGGDQHVKTTQNKDVILMSSEKGGDAATFDFRFDN